MSIRRRSLRKILVAVGCVVARLEPVAVAGGLALIVLGGALHLWSKGCLEQNRRLTTAGPYRFTRNPFYLANLLIDLGLCTLIGQPLLTVTFLVLWWLSYRETIEREERHLEELFPEEFEAYRAEVPRFFPSVRHLGREEASGGFSLRNDALAQGAEYARLFGLLVSVHVLWASERIRSLGTSLLDGAHDGTLAVILALPFAYLAKLALAETFRRPGTRLVLGFERRHRSVLIGVLFLLLLLLLGLLGSPYHAVVPVFWIVMMVLDATGRRRMRASPWARDRDGVEPASSRDRWRYFPAAISATAGVVGASLFLELR